MDEEKKMGRGGARPNAGRKKLGIEKVKVNIYIPKTTLQVMKDMANRREQSVAEMLAEIFK